MSLLSDDEAARLARAVRPRAHRPTSPSSTSRSEPAAARSRPARRPARAVPTPRRCSASLPRRAMHLALEIHDARRRARAGPGVRHRQGAGHRDRRPRRARHGAALRSAVGLRVRHPARGHDRRRRLPATTWATRPSGPRRPCPRRPPAGLRHAHLTALPVRGADGPPARHGEPAGDRRRDRRQRLSPAGRALRRERGAQGRDRRRERASWAPCPKPSSWRCSPRRRTTEGHGRPDPGGTASSDGASLRHVDCATERAPRQAAAGPWRSSASALMREPTRANKPTAAACGAMRATPARVPRVRASIPPSPAVRDQAASGPACRGSHAALSERRLASRRALSTCSGPATRRDCH